jgi:ferric-dicitrate binding protein FerR (iron transport regulator)
MDECVDHEIKEKIRAWFWSYCSTDSKDAALIKRFRELEPGETPTEEDFRRYAELAAQLNIYDIYTPPAAGRRGAFRSLSRRATGIAASLLAFLTISGLAWLWINGGEHPQPPAGGEVTVTATHPGETVRLPDGSLVTLGGGATIRYDRHFTGDRSVSLAGQAVFDVIGALDAAGERRPFTVRTDDIDVDVLGTVFRVDAPANSDFSQISLYKGSVNISSPGATIKLQPGEECLYDNGTNSLTVSLIAAEEMIRQGVKPLLRFDRASLAEVMLSLEANFGVQFVLPPGIDVDTGAISADFEGLAIDEIAGLLSITDKQYSYTLDENTITITQK